MRLTHPGWLSLPLLLALTVLSLTGCDTGASSARNASGGCSTKDEVQQAITKSYEEDYLSDHNRSVWKITGVEVEFGEIKFGEPGSAKQVEYGKDAQPTCPARVKYTVTTSYSNKEPGKKEYGNADEVHHFYRNGYDEWTFKIKS